LVSALRGFRAAAAGEPESWRQSFVVIVDIYLALAEVTVHDQGPQA
jgi:hypothetical protein